MTRNITNNDGIFTSLKKDPGCLAGRLPEKIIRRCKKILNDFNCLGLFEMDIIKPL